MWDQWTNILVACLSCSTPRGEGMLLVPQDAAGTPASQPGALWFDATPSSDNYLAAATDERVVLARGGEALLSFDQDGSVYVHGHRAKDDHEIAAAVREWAKAIASFHGEAAIKVQTVKPSCDASCAGREP